jgi:hypothetical protein
VLPLPLLPMPLPMHLPMPLPVPFLLSCPLANVHLPLPPVHRAPDNPNGHVAFAVAENRLNNDMLLVRQCMWLYHSSSSSVCGCIAAATAAVAACVVAPTAAVVTCCW